MTGWSFLFLAILFEVLASSSLKASEGFSRLWPTLAVLGGYGLAFYFLSLALKSVPLSLAYAVWSGVGTVAIALIGAFFFGEAVSPKGWLGIALVVMGVVLIRLAD
ncbi:QacE family quaternary ammonium compound efflux SMR transporter [Thermus composti]|uniref:DMT family transporter n=1 Tax=Thermus composti TaxID=532059 RepID=A0ABV6PYZ8_9DEIN|nr:multidrug efflux SMR transporter [Thermus composti]GGM93898.1 QacE family quaternary ammonium compound efflux SMR transporter [Thermus composti]